MPPLTPLGSAPACGYKEDLRGQLSRKSLIFVLVIQNDIPTTAKLIENGNDCRKSIIIVTKNEIKSCKSGE